MRKFSNRSKTRLLSCEPDLRDLMEEVLQVIDITILEGHRSPERQRELFLAGKTKVEWSKHNEYLSQAVDVSPYPIPKNWGSPGEDRLYSGAEMKARAEFYYLGGVIKGIAYTRGIPIRWGGDWDSDNNFADQRFDDLVHFELML